MSGLRQPKKNMTTTTKTSTLTDAHSRTTVTVSVLVRSTTTATWTVTVANIMFQMIQARFDCTYEDENGNETSLVNMIPDDGKDAESIVTDKLFLKLLFERLDELMPEAKLIGELRLKGQNDNVISQQMNMPRTTMLSRLNKVKKILEKEFPEIFEILSSK